MSHHSTFKMGFVIGALAGIGSALLFYRNRKMLRRELWKFRARAELHNRLRDMKDFTRENYDRAVDEVMRRYRIIERIAAPELDAFARELKDRFNHVRSRLEKETEPKTPDEQDEEQEEKK